MGLDISLVRIIGNEVEEHCWMVASEVPELYPIFSHLIRVKHFKYLNEEYDEQVYFYEEIAYQRKAVIQAFYEDFENDKCLIDKKEAEKMWHYIIKEQQQNFKTYFVNQFIHGETVITISW